MSGQDDRGHVGRERAARHRRRLAVLAEESLHTNPFHLLVKVKVYGRLGDNTFQRE